MTPGAPITDLHGIELPPRYEIRQITGDIADWVSALVWHGHYFTNLVFTGMCETGKAKEALKLFHGMKRWYRADGFPCKNGLSYCIIDKEFQYKRPESEVTGGACYWDEFDLEDPNLEQDGQQKLLDALDFPIVSFGFSYDKFAPGDSKIWERSMEFVPFYVPLETYHQQHDPRPKGSWEPTAAGQVIERIGTGTRQGYAGQGLMKALARFIMLEMKSKGYRAIQIGCAAPQVYHVWSNPPAPFRSSTLSSFPNWFYEEEKDGKKVRPFEKAKYSNVHQVWTELLDE
ncbi:hypothetical protein F4778DRAFT_769731 [Xylariomycetidae sp. FL2044]|nr:hypothetical protein F4778DRAFT_769731 [Xylariomycetidae sp. FL2044]